jgi:hypothetical protein
MKLPNTALQRCALGLLWVSMLGGCDSGAEARRALDAARAREAELAERAEAELQRVETLRLENAALRARIAADAVAMDAERARRRRLEQRLDRLTEDRLKDSLALRALLLHVAESEQRPVDGEARNALFRELAGRFPELAGFLLESQPVEATAPEAGPVEAGLSAAEAARTQRLNRFNALLTVSDVRGLDVLELGEPLPPRDEGGLGVGRGPVVVRLLDAEGRLRGRIAANALTLEGSQAGHSLALVFLDGSRRESGVETSFAGGEYRLTFRYVDPEPFAIEFPELFDPERWALPMDDGRWSLPKVRRELNVLLSEDIDGARFRLEWLGGVVDDVLRDVELSETGPDGKVRRRLFADRLRLSKQSGWIVLLLQDGVSFQGEVQAPFLDGQLRLVLPRANLSAWEAAGLPGLAPDDPGEPSSPQPDAEVTVDAQPGESPTDP